MKRNPSALIIFLLTVALGIFAAPHLPAQTVYVSNLADADDGGVYCAVDSWDAAEFTTGASAGGYSLNSIQIAMDGVLPANSSPIGFAVWLAADSGGQPGGNVGALTGSSNPNIPGTYTYTASGITLSPSTSYWIVATAATTLPKGGYLWGDTASSAYTSSGGWSINNATRDISHDGGSTWTATSVSLLRFNVSAGAVPEPKVIVLTSLVLAVVSLRRRK